MKPKSWFLCANATLITLELAIYIDEMWLTTDNIAHTHWWNVTVNRQYCSYTLMKCDWQQTILLIHIDEIWLSTDNIAHIHWWNVTDNRQYCSYTLMKCDCQQTILLIYIDEMWLTTDNIAYTHWWNVTVNRQYCSYTLMKCYWQQTILLIYIDELWLTTIALSRDPSTRHLDGQFQIWTGGNFRGWVTTRHSVIRPRPGSLYDGCHRVITGI